MLPAAPGCHTLQDRQAKWNSSKHILTLHLPLSSSLSGLQCHTLLGAISQHMANIPICCGSQGLRAACKIWANLCSLDPSQLWISRCLHLGLACASRGWIFTLCLRALPQEVPVSCGSYSAILDPSLTQVHMKLPRLSCPFLCGTPLFSA